MKNNFLKSIIAGFAIGLGGWVYLMAPNPIVGAILFSCGLLSVRIYNLHLFTGKVQYINSNENPWYYYPLILLGNFIGVAIIAAISYSQVHEAAAVITAVKCTQSLITALIKGFGCGMLMSFATNQKTPLWATPIGVVAFILAGMNHCIADFYYMCASLTFTYTLLATIIGNILGGLTFNAKINH